MDSPSLPPASPNSTYSHLLYVDDVRKQSYFQSSPYFSSRRQSISYFSMSSSSVSSSGDFDNFSTEDIPTPSSTTSSVHSATIASPKFVDDHYPLISSLDPSSTVNLPSHVPRTHAAVWCAKEMTKIHNGIIRALNSSYNHAVTVKPSTQRCRDFLQFNQVLCTTLDHHHEVEDEFLFPAWEKLLGRPGAMEENTTGHEAFMAGLHRFQKYVNDPVTIDNFSACEMRRLIGEFAPELIQHLHDEIPTILSLHVVNEKDLKKVWAHAQKLATKAGSPYIDAPFMLGCQDREFMIDGEDGSMTRPKILEVMIRKWHAKKYAGAWEFLPSDLQGRRRLMSV